MATVDKIRNGLIDKILPIEDKAFLEIHDKLVSSGALESGSLKLTKEQKLMLKVSVEDIKNEDLICQEAMNKRNLECFL